MSLQIKKAVRLNKKIRMSLAGPSGAGKTTTLIAIGVGLSRGGRILVIDVEHGRASFHADVHNFDVIELEEPTLDQYFEALKMGEGYDVVIVDPLSHAWDAINEENTNYADRTKGANTFQAWAKKGNPLYNKLIQTIMKHPAHVLCSLRVKSDYVMEEYTGADGKTRTKPVKVGLAAKFREGGEYEFDITGNITLDHRLFIEKSPPTLGWDEKVFDKPGVELGTQIRDWLALGAIPIVNVAPPPVTNGDGGIRKAVKEIPEFTGNPWSHVVQGENTQQGVPLCMVDDPTGDWFNKAFNKKVPNKNLSAMDIAALQKILTQDDDFNFHSRLEAKREHARLIEAEQYQNVESESEA